MPCVKRLVGSEDDIIVMHMNERLEEKLRHLLRAEAYHWDFIVATLIYSRAKGGLSYSEGGSIGWWEEKPGTSPPPQANGCNAVRRIAFRRMTRLARGCRGLAVASARMRD